MIIEHLGKTPKIHPTAYIAPNSTICGDVSIGENSCIRFGATVVADGSSIDIGNSCVVFENAVLRSTATHSLSIGDYTLLGPHSHVVGCTIGESVFIATGASVFYGAVLGHGSEVRINGVVHLLTHLPANTTVPIGWVAVGNPAEILSPNEHERIWSIQKPLNFPKTAYGVDRPPEGETVMPEITKRLAKNFKPP